MNESSSATAGQGTQGIDRAENVRWRLIAGATLLAAAFLFLFRLGARALWSSEGRWGEIAREMILTSNYFWPTINGRLYYDKPLLSYWLVVGASHLTGGLNEAATRLPCVAAGLLGVALVIALTRRLYDWRQAAIAGFILGTSYSFVFFSRHASADVETLTGVLAVLVLFVRNWERQSGWWVVGLWQVMAVTSLTKGLLGFALPIAVIGSFCCLEEGWRGLASHLLGGPIGSRLGWLRARNRWLFNWFTPLGIALGLAIYYLPFAISQARTSSDVGLYMVFRENVIRFFHPFDHRGPIYLYTYVIFALMAPWSVFLPAALVQAHHALAGVTGQAARRDCFVLVYFWAIFIFFTLSGSRRSYYLLPILPAAAVLIAGLWTAPRAALSPLARKLMGWGYAMLTVGVLGAFVILLPSWMRPVTSLAQLPPVPGRAVFAPLWMLCVGSIGWVLLDFHRSRVLVSSCVIAYLSMIYGFGFAMPGAERYRGEKSFAQAVRSHLRGDLSALAVFNDQGPFFYLAAPKPLPAYQAPAALAELVRSNAIRWVITRERDVSDIGLPASVVIREQSFPWERSHQRNGKQVLLKIEAAAESGSGEAAIAPP